MPTPACTAAQRLSASAFSIFDMVQIGTINDRSWMAGSANAAVVVSIRTSKPSAFSQPRIIEAQRSGSCPGQPPQTIIALRMFPSSVDLSGFTSSRQHCRPLDAALDLDAPSLVGGGLERLHHLQHMERKR